MSVYEYYILMIAILIGAIFLAYGMAVNYSRATIWTGIAIICCSGIVAIL